MPGLEERSNLSFRVARQLGRGIVCGEFVPGEPFPTEAELAGEFGVSRTAIREAVKMLAAKGLVSSKPRQGIRIQPEEAWNIFDPELLQWSLEGSLSRAVLREFFQMRAAIEPEAAALGADVARPARLQAIGEALGRMLDARAGTAESRKADIDFHVAILYATENRFYIRMRDFIRTALDVSIRFTTSESVAYADTLDQHASVHRAMQRRQPDAARRAMRRLIDEAVARL
ncbi:MAG TPA: FadR/GntR family transcriptional regulator [Woeseiaceae bacterium]|nr:FadR/GntR family transcriptional regulator [Woeseiaceae bacterium]